LNSESGSEESMKYISSIINMIKVKPTIRLDRSVELYSLIKSNSSAFVDNCIAQNPVINLNDYSELYNFNIPPECQTRLDGLADFKNQPIEDGNVTIANVDIYEVVFTDLPDDLNEDGNEDSMNDTWEHLRQNFSEFASGSKNGFEPECFGVDNADISWSFGPYFNADKWKWKNDPISTIFKISADASGPSGLAVDQGAIIISQKSDCCFVGSTIYTPETESQPFSGNRQWGYKINTNGQMVVYTKAIDVAHLLDFTKFMQNLLGPDNCAINTYYNIASETWLNLQAKIISYINDKGGSAELGTTEAIKIDFNKVVEILEQDTPIISISCN